MNTIEGEYEEVHHEDYRVLVYNRIEGEMLEKVVTAQGAKELYEDGWRMSPAEFSVNAEEREDVMWIAIVDDFAQRRNFLLNFNHCEDKMALRDFATEFLKIKVRKNAAIATLKRLIDTKANEEGLLEDDDSTRSN